MVQGPGEICSVFADVFPLFKAVCTRQHEFSLCNTAAAATASIKPPVVALVRLHLHENLGIILLADQLSAF